MKHHFPPSPACFPLIYRRSWLQSQQNGGWGRLPRRPRRGISCDWYLLPGSRLLRVHSSSSWGPGGDTASCCPPCPRTPRSRCAATEGAPLSEHHRRRLNRQKRTSPQCWAGSRGRSGQGCPSEPGRRSCLALSSVVCVFPLLGRTRGRLDEGHPSDRIYLNHLLKHLSPNTATLRGVGVRTSTCKL